LCLPKGDDVHRPLTQMKVSIITVARNAGRTIADAVTSVAAQDYSDIEHIIIDGASTDRTIDIVKANATGNVRWISETDAGIYQAMTIFADAMP
jgi:glycosyltransferase involved in cell wall biosynthesis